MEVKIRKFTMVDYQKTYELWMEELERSTDDTYTYEKVTSFLKRNPTTCFIATCKEEIVGSVLGGYDGRRGYIHHLCVSEKLKGNGIGRELIKTIEDAFNDLDAGKAHLMVYTENISAQEFYKKMGYHKREDIYIFSRRIDS